MQERFMASQRDVLRCSTQYARNVLMTNKAIITTTKIATTQLGEPPELPKMCFAV